MIVFYYHFRHFVLKTLNLFWQRKTWFLVLQMKIWSLTEARLTFAMVVKKKKKTFIDEWLNHVFSPKPTRKSRSHSSKSAKKTMSPKTPKKRSSCSAKVTTTEVDILSPAAMENIYYIAHNAADCLEFRGFGWPNSKKKKKGTKRKKNWIINFAKENFNCLPMVTPTGWIWDDSLSVWGSK